MAANTADVIIIGAGAAGLACARELLARGLEPVVLEARDRIGGRVLTLPDGGPAPVELGAEFIHGANPTLLRALEKHGIPLMDAVSTPFIRARGRLREFHGCWERYRALAGELSAHRWRERDVREITGRDDLYRAYVEGFYAADPRLLGEKGLALAEQEEEREISGTALFRPMWGYAPVLEACARALGERVRLGAEVERLEWGRNGVRAHSSRGLWHAPAVVVTVPVGVLKAGRPRLDPWPQRLVGALDKLHMGHVQRLVFTFGERFWESLTEKPLGFLLAKEGANFPTWWTQLPVHTNRLVAWQGGPRAEAMVGWPLEKRVETALGTLAKLTGKSRGFLQALLVRVDTMDWGADPYSLGAYGYLGVGGVEAARRLARPFGDSLYFAGEITAPGRSQGTVHGALESGKRAAAQVARRLRKTLVPEVRPAQWERRLSGEIPYQTPEGQATMGA